MTINVEELEQLPMEELKKLAEAQVSGEEVTLPEVTQEEVEKEAKQRKFRREIDLEDGSGVQVFEGATLDELLEKLTTAQKNATKKIREQNQKLRSLFPDDEKEEQVKEPEFKTDADKIDWLIQERRKESKAQKWNELTNAFVELHPEYPASPKSARRLLNYMRAEAIPATMSGLERAFKELVEDGLLTPVSEQEDVGNDTEPEAEQSERIAKPAKPAVTDAAPRKRVTSGLSARNNMRNVNEGPKEADMYKMPMEELRQKAQAQVRALQQ